MMRPVIRRFAIKGLYRYKDVEIVFRDNALILIAGNGSGKTTILNALHAVLRRRFFRLRSLEFQTIECEFFSDWEPIVIHRHSLGMADERVAERLSELAGYANVADEDMYDYVLSTYRVGERSPRDRINPMLRRVYTESPYNWDQIWSMLDNLSAQLSTTGEDELKRASTRIRDAMKGIDILYLPTYRRVENPLLSPRGKQRRSPNRISHEELPGIGDTSQINFGLEDVEARLNQLSEEIERVSSVEYRSLSATIIDEVLADRVQFAATSQVLPDIDSLKRFLARVSKDSRTGTDLARLNLAPDEEGERRISAIAKLYESGEIYGSDRVLLRYFLGRIGGVIEKTRATESMLQRFVEACNIYLRDSGDEKIFTYDANLMKVSVVNFWTFDEIPLAQLSSGEKQIVSIQAKLHLYHRPKLVLIDEPELSLSIDWQRRILPDMMASGSVRQLLAITHSPFIFENDLDPYAGPLQISRQRIDVDG